MDKSRRKCESLWVWLMLRRRSEMKRGHTQRSDTPSPVFCRGHACPTAAQRRSIFYVNASFPLSAWHSSSTFVLQIRGTFPRFLTNSTQQISASDRPFHLCISCRTTTVKPQKHTPKFMLTLPACEDVSEDAIRHAESQGHAYEKPRVCDVTAQPWNIMRVNISVSTVWLQWSVWTSTCRINIYMYI